LFSIVIKFQIGKKNNNSVSFGQNNSTKTFALKTLCFNSSSQLILGKLFAPLKIVVQCVKRHFTEIFIHNAQPVTKNFTDFARFSKDIPSRSHQLRIKLTKIHSFKAAKSTSFLTVAQNPLNKRKNLERKGSIF
jgi:hypothetical protein